MEKNAAFLVSSLVALVLMVGILYYTNILALPTVSLSLGMLFIGIGFPEMIRKIRYSHTVWVPIGFTVAGILGLYFMFGDNAFLALTSFNSCNLANSTPCYPYGLFFVSFFLGNAGNWAANLLSGKNIDLIEG